MSASSKPKVLPPTKPGHSSSNTTFTVKSEQDCQDFLRREVSSLPEREVPPNNQEPPPSDGQVTYLPRGPSQSDGTSTNLLITRTVRAAMADILSGS